MQYVILDYNNYNVGLIMEQHRRRWANINPASVSELTLYKQVIGALVSLCTVLILKPKLSDI